MHRSMKIKTLGPLIAIIIIAHSVSCSPENKKTDDRAKYVIPDSLMRTLIIDTVRTCPMANALTFTGAVDFNQDNQVNIFPMVSGIIDEVTVQLGDYVKAGQVLARIRSSEMAGYSNNLVIAETNLSNTQKLLQAQKDLFKSGLASQLDVNAAQTNYDQAVAQLEMVRRILKINGDNTKGEFIVKAPISGFIVQKNITNNTTIRADNGNNILTISDLKNVWVQANVYESNISKVHVGEMVNVTTLSYPGRVFKGKVDKILNVLDPTNKVMKMRVVLPNPDYALKPQMFASVTVINKGDGEALCIPSSALIFDHSQYYVLSFHANNDVRITPVKVLSALDNKTYLSSGINEGETIIASQALLIYDALNY